MLKNFVLETANAPGASTTFNLGGAASGRLSFSGAGFTSGQLVFYVMDDGTQKEWGIGTFTTGSPNTLSRTTVISTTASTTTRLNFAGTTNVYNSLPAEYTAYRNSTGALDVGTPGNVLASGKQLFRGHLNGLTTSRNVGTPNTKIDISVGAAMDEISQAGFITSSSVLTIDATTVGANGLDTGSLGVSTWYNIHAIGKTDGTVAGFLSTSLTPTLPSGYTLRRRIGSVQTDASSHFLAYNQTNDRFDRATPVQEFIGSPGSTAAQNLTLANVPPGVVVEAILSGTVQDSTAGNPILYISSLAQADVAATVTNLTVIIGGAAGASAFGSFSGFRVVTNTAGVIRYRPNSTTISINIDTHGWIDTRGRFA